MAEPIYDVFLTHAVEDSGLAALVTREFEIAGCGVFPFQSIEAGDDFRLRVVSALVESSAVVILLTKSSASSQIIAFEIGVAMAWSKPVFVLYDGLLEDEIPVFLREYRLIPLTKLGEVIPQVLEVRKPLTDSQRAWLTETYEQMRVSVDRLLLDQAQLQAFTEAYRERDASLAAGKPLMQELVRLRKLGKLPRVGDRRELPAAS